MTGPEVIDINTARGKGSPAFRLLVALVVLAAALVATTVFTVSEGEYKVVRQWGAVVRIIDTAGLQVKVPFVQSTQSLPKYKMVYDSVPTEILTADKKPLKVDNYTIWRIKDPRAFIQSLQNTPNAEKRLDATVYSVVRNKFSNVNYDEIVSGKRGDLNAEVTRLVQEFLDANSYGIQVIDVRIKRTDLPEQNQQSVFNRMKSEREKIAQGYLSEGDEQARTIRADTDRTVKEIMAEAYATAKSIEGEGEQEAARIYNDAYGKDPQFYEMYRTLESYKTTLNGKPVIVLPINSPYTRLLMGK
ncbi:tail fiber protein [Clostridiales bacterium PH28_bin88]|nr:tail fiber protein [Clostridiales bacterium PH28_bin88]